MRRGKRLLGMTEPGRELAAIVERILLDTQNIKKLAEQFAKKDRGQLDVATTHTQARYALLPAVEKFRSAFPNVHLVVHRAVPPKLRACLQMALQTSASLRKRCRTTRTSFRSRSTPGTMA